MCCFIGLGMEPAVWGRGYAVTSCGLHLGGWLRRFCQAVLHVCHLAGGFSGFLFKCKLFDCIHTRSFLLTRKNCMTFQSYRKSGHVLEGFCKFWGRSIITK